MRIGSDDSYLSVERVGQEGSNVFWRIEAAVAGGGWRFTAIHDRVQVDTTGETFGRIRDFTSHRIQQFEMILAQGVGLHAKRDLSGRVLIRYRVGQVSPCAALEGAAVLKGETVDAFCRQLEGLL
jgi:hypothetical protein